MCYHFKEKQNNHFLHRRIQPDDLSFITACKDDVKLFKAGRKNSDRSQELNSHLSPESPVPPAEVTPTEQRRERKSKFNVKDIFNFRKQGASVSDGVRDLTPERKADGGSAAAVAAKIATSGPGGGLKKRRHLSSSSKSNSSEVRSDCEDVSAGKASSASLSMTDVGDGELAKTTANSWHGDSPHGQSDRTPHRQRDGLQTRRRGKSSSSTLGRPPGQDKDKGDRNGNSSQVPTISVLSRVVF
jgi:hypothetical protein